MIFRPGILTYDQLPEHVGADGLRPAFAFTLLEQFPTPLSARDEEAVEIIYDQILAGPHAKRTFVNRYNTLDPILAEMIDERWPAGTQVRIHDMAASNGITSVELFEALTPGRDVSVFASDFFDCFHIVTVPDSKWQVIFDATLEPVQFVGHGLAIPATRPERKRFWVNRLIRWYLRSKVLPKTTKLLADGVSRGNKNVRRFDQFHPKAISLAKRDPRFTYGRDDLFNPAPAAFEVVRIMSAYAGFPDDAVRESIRKIRSTLVESGLLMIGRNRGRHSSEYPTSFYERRGDTLKLVKEIDGGSELKHLID